MASQGGVKLPGVPGSTWPTEQAHDSCSYFLQKPGRRPTGPAYMRRLLRAWTEPFPSHLCPIGHPRGRPRAQKTLSGLVSLYTLRLHEPRQVDRDQRAPREVLGVAKLLAGVTGDCFKAAFAQKHTVFIDLW